MDDLLRRGYGFVGGLFVGWWIVGWGGLVGVEVFVEDFF